VPDATPSETLRAAAVRLRELAAKTTPGPWKPWTFNRPEADAVWIVVLQPVVAEPLALILESYIPAAQRVEAQVSLYAVREAYDAALAFARTILEQP
jgi:hypothetical protein